MKRRNFLAQISAFTAGIGFVPNLLLANVPSPAKTTKANIPTNMTHPSENNALVFRGYPNIHCCCDSTWRRLPNGEQAVFFMTGGCFEPEAENFVAMCRSKDEGTVWEGFEVVHRSPECEFNQKNKIPQYFDPKWRERLKPDIATTMSEVVIHKGVITVYMQIHDGHFGYWKSVTTKSSDHGKTWSKPEPFSALPRRSMIRNLYRTSWGEYLLPFQLYTPKDGNWDVSPMDDGSMKTPQTGVLVSDSPDGPWKQIALFPAPAGWPEVNMAELSDERLVMLARSDLGMLFRTESKDKGRTWSEYVPTDIPNPASKFRLFKLRDGRIALLHNPNPVTKSPNKKLMCNPNRNPLSLWISSDDMKSWGYKRDICTFPGHLAYPDGELDADEKFLHFAFDYNRHDVIYYKVAIPEA